MRLITTTMLELSPDDRADSFVEAVIAAERLADTLQRTIYLYEIGHDNWQIQRVPLPYYNSTEIKITPALTQGVNPVNVYQRNVAADNAA